MNHTTNSKAVLSPIEKDATQTTDDARKVTEEGRTVKKDPEGGGDDRIFGRKIGRLQLFVLGASFIQTPGSCHEHWPSSKCAETSWKTFNRENSV